MHFIKVGQSYLLKLFNYSKSIGLLGRRSTGNQDVRYNQDGGGLSPRGDFAQRPPNYPKGGRNSANESVGKVSQGGRRDSNQNDLGAEKVKQANLSQVYSLKVITRLVKDLSFLISVQ